MAQEATKTDWCPACQKEVGASIEIGGPPKFAPVRSCATCGNPLPASAPVPESTAAATQSNVVPLPRAMSRAPTAPPPAAAPRSAEDLVEQARAQLAGLDLEIVAGEAKLAGDKARRRALKRMIDTYDRSIAKG